MVKVAKLQADLEANTSNFETGLNRSNRLFNQIRKAWGKNLKDIDASFAGLGKGVAGIGGALGGIRGAIAAVAGGAGLTLLVKNSLDAADAIADTSQRLQIGTRELQRFQYAAKLNALDAETLETAITKLNAQIGEGKLKYSNAAEGLYSIADAVKNAKDETQRTAIVNDAFGNKLGAKLIPLLSNGADGLRNMGDEAEKLGVVLSDKTIKGASDFNDTLDMIGTTIARNFQQGFLDTFVEQSGELRDVYTDPKFAEGIKEVGKTVGELTEFILKSISALGRFIAAYRDLQEQSKGSYGLDEKFFRYMSQKFDTPENQAKTNARLRAKYNTKDYGEQFGPFMPQAAATPKVEKYNSTEENAKKKKASDDAAASAKKQSEALADLFRSLQNENDELQLSVDTYGQKESAVARANKALQINNQLAKLGITLSAQQRKDLDAALDKYGSLIEQQKEQAEATERQKQADRDRAQAFQELTSTFESAFEAAAMGGEKLSDVLNSLLKDIQKLALRQYVTKPLTDALFGSSGGGGLLGQLGASIFGSFSSHAAGISYVPRDALVRVHKGEEIVNRREVDRGRGGGYSKVNIYNSDSGNKVSAQPSQDGESLDVKIDRVVARKLGQKGSRSNQALETFANRTIIRR